MVLRELTERILDHTHVRDEEEAREIARRWLG